MSKTNSAVTLLIGSSGYIGEYLMRKAFENKLNFVGVDRKEGIWTTHITEAANLETDFLAKFDTVLFFGGSSSVSASERDPVAALLDNVTVPALLASKLRSNQKLIYASSASVYGRSRSELQLTKSNEMAPLNSHLNMYDVSKSSLDKIMAEILETSETTGLRMGTVSGYNGSPPSFRRELVFNSMNLSAIEHGFVKVSNPECGRSLLFLDDLYLAIEALITAAIELPKFLNLYSLNTRIRDIANAVAEFYNATVEEEEPSPSYSFQMDSLYANTLFVKSQKSLEERCAEFLADWSSR